MPVHNKHIVAKQSKKRLDEYFNDIRTHQIENPSLPEEFSEPTNISLDLRSFLYSDLKQMLQKREAMQSFLPGHS